MRLISYALVAISIACARLPSFWYTAAIFWYEVATSAEAPLRVLYITIGHGHFPGGHPDLDIEPDDSRTRHTGVLIITDQRQTSGSALKHIVNPSLALAQKRTRSVAHKHTNARARTHRVG